MKALRAVLALPVIAAVSMAAAQTDHDNLDAGRPLRFEDVEPIAFRGYAIEAGLGASFRSRGGTAFDLPVEWVYGLSLNTQLELGFLSTFGDRPGGDEWFDIEEAEIGYLYSFRQEIRSTPGFAVKGEVAFPVNGGASDPHFRARAIWSKTARQYDRFHLNVDASFAPGADGDERELRLGAILGYTRPIGYFRHFDTTALAELGIEQGELVDDDASVFAGVGMRRQLTPRAVLDLGLQTDLVRERNRSTRLVVGYSTSF